MNHYKLDKRVASNLQTILSWDFKVAIGVAISSGIINLFLLAYKVGHARSQDDFEFSRGVYISGNDFSHVLNTIRLIVIIALLITAVGLWLQRSIGFLLSLAALISIFLTYAWWYFDTISYLRNTEVNEHTMATNPFYKEMGLLHGATSWDWVVLIIAIVLFIWVGKFLIRILVLSHDKQNA